MCELQRPRARAYGGKEDTTSWHLRQGRLLAENHIETQRTPTKNAEGSRARKDRLPVVSQVGGKGP